MKKWYVFDNRGTKTAALYIDELKAQSQREAVEKAQSLSIGCPTMTKTGMHHIPRKI